MIGVTSGAEALDVLARLALRDEPVALIAADQRMPRMTGIELFAASRGARAGRQAAAAHRVRRHRRRHPGDQRHRPRLLPAEAVGPAAERLYPVVDDLLGDWRQAHPDHSSEIRVVGNRWSDRAHEIKLFLSRNHVPYLWYDVERDAEGGRLSDLADAEPEDLPLVLVPGGQALHSPSPDRPRRRARACTRRPASPSTTSASSVAVRPAWRPPCTPPRRVCRRWWSSVRPPVVRRDRAPRSRTTSASRAG